MENSQISDCGVEKFKFHSDHRLVACTWSLGYGRNFKCKRTNGNDKPNSESSMCYSMELEKLLTGSESSEELGKAMKKASRESSNVERSKLRCKLPQQILNQIQKREFLKYKTKKSGRDKIELNILCKQIKRDLRAHNESEKQKIVEGILANGRSTRKMKRELSLGKDLMIHLEDESGEVVTDRSKINELATKFYEDLY